MHFNLQPLLTWCFSEVKSLFADADFSLVPLPNRVQLLYVVWKQAESYCVHGWIYMKRLLRAGLVGLIYNNIITGF